MSRRREWLRMKILRALRGVPEEEVAQRCTDYKKKVWEFAACADRRRQRLEDRIVQVTVECRQEDAGRRKLEWQLIRKMREAGLIHNWTLMDWVTGEKIRRVTVVALGEAKLPEGLKVDPATLKAIRGMRKGAWQE